MNTPHDSAITHVTGQSEYVDDRPILKNEVFVDALYSPYARAKIKKINLTPALKDPDVIGVFTAKDLKHNLWGSIFQDQPLIAEHEIYYAGEVVALIAATSKEALKKAKKLIQVQYEVLPAIKTIAEAIQQKSFIGTLRKIERGHAEQSLKDCEHTLHGRLTIHGADHFYLESQAAVAYPKENGQIEVHASVQHPTEVQHVVAHALGISDKNVTCIVKRMGGGFGGKESQGAPIAAYAALVAHKLKRPARMILTKDDDMIMTGKRNPFEIEYWVGFDRHGIIHALDAQLYSDGGAYADLSTAIMERAMLHSDNAYFIKNFRVTGQVCRTHHHPHTAFRGFGGPKGVALIETIIEQIAQKLGKDSLEIRKLNCYSNENGRNTAPYGQIIENNCLPELFSQLEKKCDYSNRRQEILEHNKNQKNKTLRGLSMTAVKFGISFTTRFLNQANALVVLHRDGSVQVSTGATEMGQGVNTRIAAVVAEELGININQVQLMATSTDKNANTSPTAASSGTDLNAAAAALAAQKIKSRLSELALKLFELPEQDWARNTAAAGSNHEIALTQDIYDSKQPFQKTDFFDVVFEKGMVFHKRNSNKKIPVVDLIREAYLNRISLSDYAHYKIPDIYFNKITGQGEPFLYYTQGTAASEVAIDRATGEVKVLRTDILMDLGVPICEGLDLGQVTGGFVQGMGWVTTENLFYSKDGVLLSHSPSTYKIPNIQDIPRVFNVDLFENKQNTKNIRKTKASGEPPLLLAISVWTAIQDAIKNPNIQIPATQEVVLRAMQPDKFRYWDQHH